jgi:hypothetical protein
MNWQQTLQEIKGAYKWEEINDHSRRVVLRMSECGSGNGTDCEPDPAMLSWARETGRSIRKQWPGVRVTLDTIDEWVCVEVEIDKEKEE